MDAPRKNPGVAFLLSVIPGAGHVYAGSTGAGVVWLLAVVVLYNAVPALGLFLHFVCAARAAQTAAEANRREEAELADRRETAEEVAEMLDAAVAQRRAVGRQEPPPASSDPAPRVLRAAFPVPAERLVRALAEALAAEGLLVLGVDEERGRVRASADAGGGRFAYLTGQVEGTPAGSRVRLLVDRPPGTEDDPAGDDRALRSILQRTEGILLAGASPGGATAPATIGPSEALTEDHFLEQLREAWEAFDQGWMPEEEWRKRRAGLVAGVSLRPGTRPKDFLAACRPLAEAGVLESADIHALETRLG